MPTVSPPTTAAYRPIERAEAIHLLSAEGTELVALMQRASALRDEGKGRQVTYSRKVFIPLTNLCRDVCGYCTFARLPDDPKSQTMDLDAVIAVARAGERAGCREALFSLGDKPELRYPRYRSWLHERGYETTIDYLVAACEAVLEYTRLLPHVNPGALTVDDLIRLRRVSVSAGMMLESTSDRLLEPGGAHRASPDKAPAVRLATLHAAGECQVPFTTGMLIGIGETLEERVDTLGAIRDMHAAYGHIQEVIIQNFRAKGDIAMRHWPEASVLDMVRTIAVARLMLGPSMNIQAPPNLSPDAYRFYLLAGINDWGGVSPVTRDFINPERAWPELDELRSASADAGFTLRERLAVYPEYIARANEFLDESLRARVAGAANDEGLVAPEDEQW